MGRRLEVSMGIMREQGQPSVGKYLPISSFSPMFVSTHTQINGSYTHISESNLLSHGMDRLGRFA